MWALSICNPQLAKHQMPLLAGCSWGRVVLDFPSLMIFSCTSVHGYCEKQFLELFYFTEKTLKKAMWPACDSRKSGKPLSVN